jgi:tRNA threonylcarbamoyl adenosine modification protein (Sua5/YciO/YrdC/YwlC family)
MSQYFAVHPTHPQPRLIAQAAAIIRDGGVIAYPTDSCYAIGCQIGDKEAMQRLRTIRKIDDKHHLTLMCRDLSEIATYAQVDARP